MPYPPQYFLSIGGQSFIQPYLDTDPGLFWSTWIKGRKRELVEGNLQDGEPFSILLGWRATWAVVTGTDGSPEVESYRVELSFARQVGPSLAGIPGLINQMMFEDGEMRQRRDLGAFQVLVDHRTQRVRLGPIGNVGLVHLPFRSCGIGSYGLGLVVDWMRRRCPTYLLMPVTLAPADETRSDDPDNRIRRNAMYAAAGINSWHEVLVSSLASAKSRHRVRVMTAPEIWRLMRRYAGCARDRWLLTRREGTNAERVHRAEEELHRYRRHIRTAVCGFVALVVVGWAVVRIRPDWVIVGLQWLQGQLG